MPDSNNQTDANESRPPEPDDDEWLVGVGHCLPMSKRRYHSNPDCSRIKTASNMELKKIETLHDDLMKECKWCSDEWAVDSHRSPFDCDKIRNLYHNSELSTAEIAEKLDASKSTIWRHAKGRCNCQSSESEATADD